MERSVNLHYSDLATGGTSDKVYNVQLVHSDGGWIVNFQYGRRGGTLNSGTKTKKPVSFEEASNIFGRLLSEKLGNSYRDITSHSSTSNEDGEQEAALPPVQPKSAVRTKFPVELLEEISESEGDAYVKSSKYWMQTKVDGHRRQIEKVTVGGATAYVSYNRKGEAVAFPSELVSDLDRIALNTFLIDGELVGTAFAAFDLLSANGQNLSATPYAGRFEQLEKSVRSGKNLTTVPTWRTTSEKAAALRELKERRAEGVAFKFVFGTHQAGARDQHKKLKFIKTCTCRVLRVGDKGHDSATLALREGSKWVEVGRASMIGKDSRIVVGSLVEVAFLYMTAGKRLYQPRITVLRTDLLENACTFAQVAKSYKEGVAA